MISLIEAKLHLRIDHTEDDPLITLYIGAAQEQIERHIQRKIITDEEVRKSADDVVNNSALKAAALLFIGNLYENREATTDKPNELPLGYWSLIQPYRVMGV